ncbi:MAG: DNA repair protein RecN, partial [Alphaproteobacteria bacterium]|nr:DNA repair protein RecN [Alphaproteobacteria bacterium]
NQRKIDTMCETALTELNEQQGITKILMSLRRRFDRIDDKIRPLFDNFMNTLTQAEESISQCIYEIDKISSMSDYKNIHELEQIEERLFKLHDLSRKYNLHSDDLSSFYEESLNKLHLLEKKDHLMIEAKKEESEAKKDYITKAEKLRQIRIQSSKTLIHLIEQELMALKFSYAKFYIKIIPLKEEQWGHHGMDQIIFEATTNPDRDAGPISSIASGGELSRFMLALKIVLAKSDPLSTLIFDEIDIGVGGSTAAAIGEKLLLLSKDKQIIVITHSPQVAAAANNHWSVIKTINENQTTTNIILLNSEKRREEIARMLSGKEISTEARFAADKLLDKKIEDKKTKNTRLSSARK